MIAAIVDKKRFKWLEEQLSGFIEKSCPVSLLAHDAPQFLQDQIAAGDGVATQHAALNSPTSSDRAPGESSRRNFRNRSTVVSTPAILGLSESKPFGLIWRWPLRLC